MFFYDINPFIMKNWVQRKGYPAYRAEQILQWQKKCIYSFDEMTNIPAEIRENLVLDFELDGLILHSKHLSPTDGTLKLVLELEDGNIIETVLMKYSYGNSACVSSQAGCKMGCSFCATAKTGFGRNLTAGEMIFQILALEREADERIGNIVVMGIGEPLDNYDNLIRFIKEANRPDKLGISMRKITVSTCGLVNEVIKFTNERLPVNLSISLHAPNDKIRAKIMPIAKANRLSDLIDACRRHIRLTGRRITFEYILLKRVNDSDENALELSRLLKGMNCHVNLIPANTFPGAGFKPSDDDRVKQFAEVLSRNRINVTVRRKLGDDINAACGQLRRRVTQGGQA